MTPPPFCFAFFFPCGAVVLLSFSSVTVAWPDCQQGVGMDQSRFPHRYVLLTACWDNGWQLFWWELYIIICRLLATTAVVECTPDVVVYFHHCTLHLFCVCCILFFITRNQDNDTQQQQQLVAASSSPCGATSCPVCRKLM